VRKVFEAKDISLDFGVDLRLISYADAELELRLAVSGGSVLSSVPGGVEVRPAKRVKRC
jgi:hypothetical protein